jgi:hypothetical protein
MNSNSLNNPDDFTSEPKSELLENNIKGQTKTEGNIRDNTENKKKGNPENNIEDKADLTIEKITCPRCKAIIDNNKVIVSFGPAMSYEDFMIKCCNHLDNVRGKDCWLRNLYNQTNISQNSKKTIEGQIGEKIEGTEKTVLISDSIISDITIEKWLDTAQQITLEREKKREKEE